MEIENQQAATLLAKEKIVAIPTDTVYGLAARYDSGQALSALYAAKERPTSMPLLVLAADISQITPFLEEVPDLFYDLASRYWPGALTLVVPVDIARLPDELRRGHKTTGFRIPNHPDALELLRQTGPLAVTSANKSGQPPAETPDALEAMFGTELPILKTATPPQGTVSTIVEFTASGKLSLLREGAVPATELSP